MLPCIDIQLEYIYKLRPYMRMLKKYIREMETGANVLLAQSHISSLSGGIARPVYALSNFQDLLRRQIVACRTFARISIEQQLQAQEDLRKMKRQDRIYRRDGVSILYLQLEIQKQRHLAEELTGQVGDCGLILCDILESWRLSGATIETLFNLCCVTPAEAARIPSADRSLPFVQLIQKYRLDYHGDPSVFTAQSFAPLTHAITAGLRRKEINRLNTQKALAAQRRQLPLGDNARQAVAHMFYAVYQDQDVSIQGYQTFRRVCDRFFTHLKKQGYRNLDHAKNYLAECTPLETEEWLDMVCPRFISKDDILKILQEEMDGFQRNPEDCFFN